MNRIGVDVGGTFTDFILEQSATADELSTLHVHKVPSTPHDQSEAVVRGVLEICEIGGIKPADIDLLVHGTTVATNITIEYDGAEIGMLTTRGFRDIMHVGRLQRPQNFSLQFGMPWQDRPLVKRRNRLPITERILPPNGEIETALDEDEVRAAVEKLKANGVEAIVVCFLFSFLDNRHEKRASEIAKEIMPDAYISCSSDVVNVIREYERFSSTAMNAFVGPRTSFYLQNLEQKLKDNGVLAELRIMQSNGGISTVAACSARPISILLSGPAGGVIGGKWTAELSNENNIISIDIGGTSADISVVSNGELKIKNPRDTYVSGYPVLTPMMDMVTIGAGGGSIAYIDDGGAFRVGPRSAGSDPGPVCYGNGGTEPTVTDANLVLGRLDHDHVLGGDLQLDPDLARKAIETKLAKPLGMSVEEAALGVIKLINSNMAMSIRANSVAQGIDPRQYSLVPFGGAGPLHGAALADIIGTKEVIVPPEPGINAALGLLVTDMRYDYGASVIKTLNRTDEQDLKLINGKLSELRDQCYQQFKADGLDPKQQQYAFIAECRYIGQGFELRAEAPEFPLTNDNMSQLLDAFHEVHYREYGRAFKDSDVEVVSVRVIGTAKVPELRLRKIDDANGASIDSAEMFRRNTVFDDGTKVETPRYDRKKLLAGHVVPGPAIIMQHNSTIVVPPGSSATVTEFGNIHIIKA